MTTQRNLKIADTLEIPAQEAVTNTLVVYGGKGMGKTNFAAVLAEELAACGKRFCIVDPVGVSWGLRHSADGKGPGLDVLILGGLHGDLPIEPTGGAVVADFVADEEQDTVVDISRRADGRMWSAGEKIRFVTAFATRLYERQGERRRPIMLMIDEAGRFVPQQMQKGAEQIAHCVGAIEQLVELGRNVGVGVTLITQRSARMAKSVSELAECMIAFRTVGPNSVGAILDWFGEHVEKSKWNALVEQLRALPRGQALVVSPGWLDFEGVAAIRKRRTFDSSSTPTGEEKRLANRGARPDLDKYRERIADTVAKAEASDPSKMRAKLAALEKRAADAEAKVADALARLEAEQAKPKGEKRVDVPVLTEHERALVGGLRQKIDAFASGQVEREAALIDKAWDKVAEIFRAMNEKFLNEINATSIVRVAQKLEAAASAVARQAPPEGSYPKPAPEGRDSRPPSAGAPPRASYPKPTPGEPVKVVGETRIVRDGRLTSAARKLLGAYASARSPLSRKRVHLIAMLKPSGDTSVAIAEFKDRGWVRTQDGELVITAEGMDIAAAEGIDTTPLPTGPDLQRHLLNGGMALSSAERKILEALFSFDGTFASRAAIHERAGLRPSGDTSVAIAKFKTLGWLDQDGSSLRASEVFFS